MTRKIFFTSLILLITIIFLALKAPKEFSIKEVQSNMVIVNDSFYVCKYECSNFEYRSFIKELENRNDVEQLKRCAVDSAKWVNENFRMEPYVNYYHRHPAYDDYPVVCVPFSGAVKFCEWITDKYNAWPKRKFKKVRFYLPDEIEWKLAARGGNPHNVYPWGGYFLRNSKGAYLANFKAINDADVYQDSSTVSIGPGVIKNSFTTTPTNSYFPNKFGLYNVAGNAAEMLNQPGKHKGGSWNCTGYYLRIDAADKYEGVVEPSPFIGFRYFMRVLEK